MAELIEIPQCSSGSRVRLRCVRTQVRILLRTVVFIATANAALCTGCALLQFLGQLSLPSLRGRLIEYQLRLV